MDPDLPLECPFCQGIIDWGDSGGDGPHMSCRCACLCETTRDYEGNQPMVTVTFQEECPFHGRAALPQLWDGVPPDA